MILVTGATGNVGSAVVAELMTKGTPVRAFVRDEQRARARLGVDVELANGDFEDPASITRALDGVEAVFLSSADQPKKVEHETAVIDAARAAGVRRIVKTSTVGAERESPLPPFDWHGRSEEHLRRSGVPCVVPESGFYMTNLLAGTPSASSPAATPAVSPSSPATTLRRSPAALRCCNDAAAA
jgi:uncharacterized protein YbjT (DUF2867 family)